MTIEEKNNSILWVEFAILGFMRDKLKDTLFMQWIETIKKLDSPDDVNKLSELSLLLVEENKIDISDRKYTNRLLAEAEKSLYYEYLVEAAEKVKKFSSADIVGAFISSIMDVIAPGAKIKTKIIKCPIENHEDKEDEDFGPLDLESVPSFNFDSKKFEIADDFFNNKVYNYEKPKKEECRNKSIVSLHGKYLSVGDHLIKVWNIDSCYVAPYSDYSDKNVTNSVYIFSEQGPSEVFKGSYSACKEVLEEIKKLIAV
jgi:hypothetical protein